MTTIAPWSNLIVGSEHVDPLTLTPHPLNFYTHPMAQRKVVSAAIDDLGYIDEVVVNRRTGHTLNGHLRVEIAIGNGEPTIPVTYVDCDEATENQILLFFDRIGEQAKVQGDRVRMLAEKVESDIEAAPLQDMLDEWVSTFEKFSRPAASKAAPVAAAPVAAAPVAVAPAPVATAPVAVAQPTVLAVAITADAAPGDEGQDAPPVALAVAPEAGEGEGASLDVGVVQEPQEPTQAFVAVDAEPAPGAPADNYAAALEQDGGAPIVAPAPVVVTVAPLVKPVVVKVGEYAQEFPADVFDAWWALFRSRVGDDYTDIVTEVRNLLQIQPDPR